MAEHSEARPVRDWQETFPWLILFRAARPAIGFRVLLVTAIGLMTMVAGWRLCWRFVAPSVDAKSGEVVISDPVMAQLAGRYVVPLSTEGEDPPVVPPWPWEIDANGNELYPQFFGKGVLGDYSDVPLIGRFLGVAETTATELTFPFQMLFHEELTYRGLAYALTCCVWALVIWGYFGGVIARIVAVKLTQDETISLKKAGSFARKRCCSYMSAPLIPLLGVFGLGIPIAVLGLISHFDVGIFITGLLWPLVLCIGFLMAILLLGLIFGWPLMFSTISTEGTDAFDAISRSYAYVFQRPFHYLFYTILTTIIGGLGWLFLHGIMNLIVHATTWAFAWGLNAETKISLFAGNLNSNIAGWGYNLILFWQGFLQVLLTSFAIGFLFSGMTAVYLLLRRHVDGVELDEVQLDQEAQYGLPVLSEDNTDSEGGGEADKQNA